ncbi:MAG: zinc metalloprotease HtpX [Chloroflexi bacterium]|nr:zinc metalloprotease HtpX [Chloroflexota bacterium]
MNNLKTVALLALLSAILMGIGFAIGNMGGLIIGFIIALVINGGAYWFSDRIALMATGAKEVSVDEAPDLHRMVEEVASLAHLPKPRVAMINNDQPNAFATGRDAHHAVVAVTTGIMSILDQRELAAVLGHELGHIRNRDVLVGTMAAVIASAISFIAWTLQWALFWGGMGGRGRNGGGIVQLVAMLAIVILAPIAAMIVRLAISRAREFGADEAGAQITGTPLALASALEKLEAYASARPMNVNPAISHLFIVNPLRGRRDGGGDFFVSLFQTHPPIPRRIERLNEIARRTGMLA